jgi:hypothetical protein
MCRRPSLALVALAVIGLAAGASATASIALADDPSASPEPIVFHVPQYLVYMETHQTMDGPVEDGAYWLYIEPPDEDGHFAVPSGDGLTWHYWGRLVGGPFEGEADACPAMLAAGVTSLQAWIVAAGEAAQIADCSRFAATPAPVATAPALTTAAPAASAPAGTDPAATDPAPSDDDLDPESLGIAVALIGLLLFGGGAALGMGPRAAAPAPPEPRPVEPPADPPRDLCFEQAENLELVSIRGRFINDLLATCRRNEALLQEQIDILANLVLPGSVLLDLGMAAGGLSGGLSGVLGRKLIASEGFRRAVGEAVVKDVLKELGKQALGSAGGGLDAGQAGIEARNSAIKQSILEGAAEGITNHRFFDTPIVSSPQRVFRNAGEYARFTRELDGFANGVMGPVKDGLGSLIDLYQGVTNGLELKQRLDNLRAIRDRIADKRVELELDFEDTLEAQRSAAARLATCRELNSPDWKP